jgi:hypothetical protein
VSDSRFSFVGRLLAEGLMVVASILVAFWLDTWWDDRELAASRHEVLAGVEAELRENRRLIAREIAILDRVTAASSLLLQAMSAEASSSSVSIADSIPWLSITWAPSLEVSHGAVDALIASGQLPWVKDPRLRMGLASLRDMFGDAIEDELIARDIQLHRLMPMLAPDVELDWFLTMDSIVFFGSGDYAVKPAPHVGAVEFPNSRVLRNTLRDKLSWLGTARGTLESLAAHLDHLVILVGVEIETTVAP